MNLIDAPQFIRGQGATGFINTIQPPALASVGLTIQGLASQSGALLQLKDSAGTVLATIGAAGKARFGDATAPTVSLEAANGLTVAAGSLLANSLKPTASGGTMTMLADSGAAVLRIGTGATGATFDLADTLTKQWTKYLSVLATYKTWSAEKCTTVQKIHTSDLFDVAGLTDSVTIFTQPAGTTLLGVSMFLEQKFAAVGLTDLDVTIGDAGDPDGILAAAMNLLSDAAGTQYKARGAYWNTAQQGGGYYTPTAKAWLAYATAVGANLNTTSTGVVTFVFVYQED